MILRLSLEVVDLQTEYNMLLRQCVEGSVEEILRHRDRLDDLAGDLLRKRTELSLLLPSKYSITN